MSRYTPLAESIKEGQHVFWEDESGTIPEATGELQDIGGDLYSLEGKMFFTRKQILCVYSYRRAKWSKLKI